MIPRSTKGSSFAGALRYDLEKDGAQMLDSNCASNNWEDIAKEMDTFAASSSSKKPVLHTSLSLPAGESMTHEQWRKAAQIYMKEMQLDKHQFVLTKHNDSKHEHVHLVINRVNEKGRLANDSNDRHRSLVACRAVEKEMGLKVIDKNYQNENVGRLNDIKNDLAASIALSKTPEQLRAQLKERGYSLILNQSKTTGRVSGASIQAHSDNKVFKMSELQKGGWRTVEKSLNVKQQTNDNKSKSNSNNNSQNAAASSSGGKSKKVSVSSAKLSDSAIAAVADEKEKAYLIYSKQLQDEAEMKKIHQLNLQKSQERER